MFGLAETQFDLKFRLLDVPVRIHPLFWVVAAVMGWRENELRVVLLWVLCVFVSILVHEYGHALMSRIVWLHSFDRAVGNGRALLQPG